MFNGKTVRFTSVRIIWITKFFRPFRATEANAFVHFHTRYHSQNTLNFVVIALILLCVASNFGRVETSHKTFVPSLIMQSSDSLIVKRSECAERAKQTKRPCNSRRKQPFTAPATQTNGSINTAGCECDITQAQIHGPLACCVPNRTAHST